MKPWRRVEPTVVTKIDFHNVVVKTFELPDGQIVTRAVFLAEGRRSATVVAITEDKKVIVARQFRPGPERIMDEFPGGYIEEGEEPEATARRELLEETGYRPGSMKFLGTYNCGTYSNGIIHYFLATDCKLVDHMVETDKFIEIELRDIDAFLENAKKDTTTDPAAVLLAYDELKRLAKEGA